MPAIAVLRVGIRATNRQDPQRVRQRGPSGRKAAEKPRAHEGKGHGPRRREGSLCSALATKKSQRRRVAQPRSTTRASERPPGKPRAQGGGGNGWRQRAGFLCGATARKKSQRRRVAKPRASHGLKAMGGLARSQRERWAAVGQRNGVASADASVATADRVAFPRVCCPRLRPSSPADSPSSSRYRSPALRVMLR